MFGKISALDIADFQGYNVEMSRSPGGFLKASNKRVIEVSLVKVGAREDCHIHGWSQGNNPNPSNPSSAKKQRLQATPGPRVMHRIIT